MWTDWVTEQAVASSAQSLPFMVKAWSAEIVETRAQRADEASGTLPVVELQ